MTLSGLDFDTMLASYLLDATRSGHALEDLALEHLGYKALTEEDVRGRGAEGPVVRGRAGRRVARLRRRARRPALPARRPRWKRSSPPTASTACTAISSCRSSRCSPTSSAPASAWTRARSASCRDGSIGSSSDRSARIFALAGEPFNINSPRQLSEILFEKLKLPALKRTGKTKAASTAVEVLEELAAAHELPRVILEWRSLQKLKGTYIDALPALVNPRDRPRPHLASTRRWRRPGG